MFCRYCGKLCNTKTIPPCHTGGTKVLHGHRYIRRQSCPYIDKRLISMVGYYIRQPFVKIALQRFFQNLDLLLCLDLMFYSSIFERVKKDIWIEQSLRGTCRIVDGSMLHRKQRAFLAKNRFHDCYSSPFVVDI